MNTDNMPDEELDNLFRQSAERLKPPYDPEAWEAMESRLDQAQPPWWHALLYPALLLLLIGSGLTVHILRIEAPPLPEAGPSTAKKQPEQMLLQPRELSAAAREPVRSRDAYFPPRQKAADRLQVNAPAGANPQKESSHTRLPLAGNVHQDSLLAMRMTRLVPPGNSDAPLPALVVAEVGKPAADSVSLQQHPRQSREFLRSLQIMLVAAPDVSTVKFKDPDGLSVNAGLLVDLPLSRRLGVVTGALWANKVYRANPDNYEPSPGYWTDRKMPASIDATCRVLDIPLNIRYRLYEGKKDVVTAQAGLSSYIMLREEYTYNYTYGTKPYSKTQGVDNRNKHWFAVQNLSASYSRKLSPALSVGVEPFVKIPLSGIGDGKVRLTSAGVFFTAGYTIPLKR